MAQEVPKIAQDCFKMAPDGPQMDQDGLKIPKMCQNDAGTTHIGPSFPVRASESS